MHSRTIPTWSWSCPGELALVTLQRNARARLFYEKRGFVVSKVGVSPAPESEPDVWYAWRATA